MVWVCVPVLWPPLLSPAFLKLTKLHCMKESLFRYQGDPFHAATREWFPIALCMWTNMEDENGLAHFLSTIPSPQPHLLSSSSVVFAVLHAVGFRVVLHWCDGKSQVPPSPSAGEGRTRMSWAQEGAVLETGRPAGGLHRPFSLFVEASSSSLLLLLFAVLRWDSIGGA
ncbi:hypothetical protein F5883DRAFT_68566 [Diaporthe sp. PMI_573]|nr:hypothetical protein F5883DRAFT_68566 [Diaporthaceae sp. PMI_573]